VNQPLPKRGQTVLIVDDDEGIREALRDALVDVGYRVATAGNGAEALDVLEASSPDAVLTDLVMPGVDGWELASRVRGNPRFAALPILVMTAHGERLLSTAPVASGYFKKPIDLARLLQGLSRSLTLRRPAPSASC
jgi:CheY-like chemotaxis protein